MEEKKLKFLKTLTVAQFKRDNAVNALRVRRNPLTGKLFFTFGAESGAVAKAGIPAHPMVSRVLGDPTPENPTGEFWLLHEEGEGGAPVVTTL